MNKNAGRAAALALALCLLFAACGGQGASPSEAPPEDLPPEETAPVPSGFPELEETEWEAVSVGLESFGISQTLNDERFEYIFNHTNTVPLDQLIVFDLWGDALTEGSSEELRSRFLEAPDTVLAYLVLMGDQRVDYWDQPLAADVICRNFAYPVSIRGSSFSCLSRRTDNQRRQVTGTPRRGYARTTDRAVFLSPQVYCSGKVRKMQGSLYSPFGRGRGFFQLCKI